MTGTDALMEPLARNNSGTARPLRRAGSGERTRMEIPGNAAHQVGANR